MGGFERATRKKKKTKNDPKTLSSTVEADIGTASGFEKVAQKRKKTKNVPKALDYAMEADTVTHSSQAHNTVLVRFQ